MRTPRITLSTPEERAAEKARDTDLEYKPIYAPTGMWEPVKDPTYKQDGEEQAREVNLEQAAQCRDCPKLTLDGGCLLAKAFLTLFLLFGIPDDDPEMRERLVPIATRFKYENQPTVGLQN
jgi:hypothetical protein